MTRTIKLYLNDILDTIELIEKSVKNVSKSEFVKDRDIIDATTRRLEIIGEAVKHVPLSIRRKYGAVEWKKIVGTRDILIHAYFKVDIDKVWNVIKDELEPLKQEIKLILEEESNK
ncbi:MAG TPA: DUF86 domain-containing protein [Candidatus Nanoarchaeia archaeon]|nr:DUF86 domain-containing protein [Candidatus Nanoarchaeia archaeon]